MTQKLDYFTLKQLRGDTMDSIGAIMRSVLTTKTSEGVPTVLEAVGAGPYVWRQRVLRETKGMLSECGLPVLVDEHVCDLMFAFLAWKVVQTYGKNPDPGPFIPTTTPNEEAYKIASDVLDHIDVPTPTTEAEFEALVDASWEVESGSSDAAQRLFSVN